MFSEAMALIDGKRQLAPAELKLRRWLLQAKCVNFEIGSATECLEKVLKRRNSERYLSKGAGKRGKPKLKISSSAR